MFPLRAIRRKLARRVLTAPATVLVVTGSVGLTASVVLTGCAGAATGPASPETNSSDKVGPIGSRVVCSFHDKRLTEISGLASSIAHDGILWTHNDSGDSARVFAIDASSCAVKAEVRLEGVSARDIEAIAVGRDSAGTPVVWVGDIGDNLKSQSRVRLYRFDEPTELKNQSIDTNVYTATYPDGPHDAEGLLVDPTAGGRIWLVSKKSSDKGAVYALPEDFVRDGSGVAKHIGSAPSLATDATYAPDGRTYAIRSYFSGQLFDAPPPGINARSIDIPLQPQGEAMTFSSDSQSLYLASEGSNNLILIPVPAPGR